MGKLELISYILGVRTYSGLNRFFWLNELLIVLIMFEYIFYFEVNDWVMNNSDLYSIKINEIFYIY